MLWIWLWGAVRWAGRLLFPPPGRSLPAVNPNATCPACGHCNGKIMCVPDTIKGSPHIIIRHTCNVCGGIWFEGTVIAEATGLVLPSESSY